MRIPIRPVLGSVVAGLLVFMATGAHARPVAYAYQDRVTIVDNDAGFTPADADGAGLWGFAPGHVTVTKGDTVEFVNAASNTKPHTVTSITWSGMAPARTLESGTKFNSSPTRDQLIMPGTSWTLDTGTLDPGQYVFYCALHPWMVGSLTVLTPQ